MWRGGRDQGTVRSLDFPESILGFKFEYDMAPYSQLRGGVGEGKNRSRGHFGGECCWTGPRRAEAASEMLWWWTDGWGGRGRRA